MEPVELLLHPVRLRIVHAMSGGRILTTADLCALLPDVSKATVYRHVGLLANGGLLAVEGEQRVRGAVERRYRLEQARAVVGADRTAAMSKEDYRNAFAVAMAALLAEFGAYLDRDGADPVADLAGFRQHALWLSPAELADLIGELRGVLVPRLANQPSPERTRHLVSPILFPAEESAARAAGAAPRPDEAAAGSEAPNPT